MGAGSVNVGNRNPVHGSPMTLFSLSVFHDPEKLPVNRTTRDLPGYHALISLYHYETLRFPFIQWIIKDTNDLWKSSILELLHYYMITTYYYYIFLISISISIVVIVVMKYVYA